ncbi:MAG: 23S rRNA (adenine(2030)-N(6))-methyltransferase RlmJ [Betaproteobacteria bacterium]|nr:23S rRNA (adenine(2030)-N(6))-methyltransferase RlmJ [Betaproteobacteria bacterium]
MFSYRHGFHAGNHADVLKHVVLVQLLEHLLRKEKPFWVVDTHAGGGEYPLEGGYAGKSREFEGGIARLWDAGELPAALASYVREVRRVNPDGALRRYPGSPRIALQMMRAEDRLRLFELHPTEIRLLEAGLQDAGRRVVIREADGFAALRSVLPPPPRRGLVLIDPSYEDKNDYRAVLTALRDGLARFATGIYAIWYPRVQRREAERLPVNLRELAPGGWLDVNLDVDLPAEDGLGLHGSGVFVINPPWTLEASLREALPVLEARLGRDAAARARVDTHHV